MQSPTTPLPLATAIPDAEWMLIHSDTFVTDRDRILLSETAFKIDRDLYTVAPTLPGSGYNAASNIA